MSERILIRGGDVIDGTGAPRVHADVLIDQGVISAVGRGLQDDDATVIDASGAVVTPGFIDTHAHTDPMVFWNPTLDPEPLHGVTTMLVGNCGLSLYPASAAARGEICDLFAYAEDVPRHLFDECLPWTWTDYAGYRDAVTSNGTGLNLAALVGHTQIRIAAMGPDAWTRPATSTELEAMCAILDAAMAAGAWGMSLSFYDVDKAGRPIPTRVAELAEFGPLVDVVARRRGFVELLPGLIHPDPEVPFEYLARRCGQGGIPLIFNGFVHNQNRPHETAHWLEFVRRMNGEGNRVVPLLSPRSIDLRINWQSSMMFMTMPQGWHRFIGTAPQEKASLLADAAWRATAREEWDRVDSFMFPHRHPELVRFVEVVGAENARWLGRTLADLIAEDPARHPSDAFADFLLANDCRPGVVAVGISNADVDGIAATLAEPDVLVSGSDAGAHVQMMCASGDTTLLLTRHVRDRGDFPLEWAVHQLTGRQADVFGFADRGRLVPGLAADIVVFDLNELRYEQDVFVPDLPGGGLRLRRPAGGYRATLVNGVVVQNDGELTGALPGRVLSSG